MSGLSDILTLRVPTNGGDSSAQAFDTNKDIIPVVDNGTIQNLNNLSLSSTPVVATRTNTIIIIHPLPNIWNIMDKTAQLVASNGPEFEKRILANRKNIAKFNFLNPSEPYHAYY